jgi:hypothetical protein
MGSGTTAVAAVRTGRHFVGFDTDRSYVQAAKERVRLEREQLADVGDTSLDAQPATAADAIASGEQARSVAVALLLEAGFTAVEHPRRPPFGVDIALVATDRRGRHCYVEVVGGLTIARNGLRKLDNVWRTLGKAAALRGADPEPHRFVVLTTELPAPRSQASTTLRRSDDLIAGAFDLLHEGTPAHLRVLADAD